MVSVCLTVNLKQRKTINEYNGMPGKLVMSKSRRIKSDTENINREKVSK